MAVALESLFVAPERTAVGAPTLTATQTEHLAALQAHFGKDGFDLAISEDIDETKRARLSEREMMFLSQECFLRFLSATKGNLEAATQRLEKAIIWRRTSRMEEVDALDKENIAESKMGKNFVLGFSPTGLPVIYFFPNRNTLALEDRSIFHTMFILERAIDLMTNGVTNVLLIFNFQGKRKGPPTSPSAARDTIHILGEYYPELLGCAIMQDMPWYIRAFVAVFWPFVDPHTKSKVKFHTGAQAVAAGEIAGDVLLRETGGELDLPYDFDTFWPAFMERCRACRAEHERRWRALGEPQVGREERLWKLPPGKEAVVDGMVAITEPTTTPDITA